MQFSDEPRVQNWPGADVGRRFAINVLELRGALHTTFHFLCGAGIGLSFVGLPYGSPKTRPMFDRFHALKLRLLGRENAN